MLGVSRTAVWKAVADLRERGIPVTSLDRRGYQLERPVELLRPARSCARRPQRTVAACRGATEVIFELGSTNEYLYGAAAPPAGSSAPRLRRAADGRAWTTRSRVARAVRSRPHLLDRLDLCRNAGRPVGAQTRHGRVRRAGAARRSVLRDVMLKWPNDVVHRSSQARRPAGADALRKRVDRRTSSIGPRSQPAHARPCDRRCTDSAITPVDRSGRSLGCTSPCTRSRSPAHVAAEMLAGLDVFTRSGFAPFAIGLGRASIRFARCARRRFCVTTVPSRGSPAAPMPMARCASRPGGDDPASARWRCEPATSRRWPGACGMMLLVDIGNTRVKWATCAHGRLSPQRAADYCAVDAAEWRDAVVRAIRASRGRGLGRRIGAAVSCLRTRLSRSGARACNFVASTAQAARRSATRMPIRRCWASTAGWPSIGAHHLETRGACCVVDIGTAATIDAVDDAGQHLGGFIVPGPRVDGALACTPARAIWRLIPLAAFLRRSTLFANNTRDAIERGCRVALAALIDRAFYELARRRGDATSAAAARAGPCRKWRRTSSRRSRSCRTSSCTVSPGWRSPGLELDPFDTVQCSNP